METIAAELRCCEMNRLRNQRRVVFLGPGGYLDGWLDRPFVRQAGAAAAIEDLAQHVPEERESRRHAGRDNQFGVVPHHPAQGAHDARSEDDEAERPDQELDELTGEDGEAK